jgi:cytochrome c oxidase subunit 4
MNHPHHRTYYAVFGILVGLLVVTVALAELQLGSFGFVAAVLIASIKAALILLYFMHVRYSRPLIWLVSAAGFFWLAILFGFTFSDYETRQLPGARRGSSNRGVSTGPNHTTGDSADPVAAER